MTTKFDERVAKCSASVREVLSFLRTVAEHAGDSIEMSIDGTEATGVTYRLAGKRFCRFDPKHEADHVWVLIPGSDRSALRSAGAISDREDGPWVAVRDMRGAVRLVPEILRGHDALRSRG